MKLEMIRVPNGYAFATAEAANDASSHRVGERVVFNAIKPRSNKFQRKFFALLRFAFDYWEPSEGEAIQYKGHQVEKDFDRFRQDVTIMCGFYTPVWGANGDMRLVARSIAFTEMEPEDFARLYSAAISVCMRLVMKSKGFTAQMVEDAVEHILRFD